MHISLTPELESIVKDKVASGLYNNASEVVREALRFMQTNEELVDRMKLNALRSKLAEGERDIAAGRYVDLERGDIGSFLQTAKDKALARIKQESQ
jgi:antitoxin ParD1/3/4